MKMRAAAATLLCALVAPQAFSQTAVSSEVVVTSDAIRESITSPSEKEAERQKTEIPGALTLKNADDARLGRASNLQDLLERTPGLFAQSENGVEVTKFSVRGSGVDSEDEPVGVTLLLDGMTYNQGDGEVLPEDLPLDSIRYAEIFRGATALRYGGLALGGAINFVPITGYDADKFAARIDVGSYGFVLANASTGAVEGPVDFFASLTARRRDGFREHSAEDTEIFFSDVGWKLNSLWENRFYLTLDRTERELPGGLTNAQMNDNPRKADPDAVAENWNKAWTYARFTDRLAFKSDALDFTAAAFLFHRDLTTRGFYSPEFRQGIEEYFSDNVGVEARVVWRMENFQRPAVLTAGANLQLEFEHAQDYENLDGRAGATTARGENNSVNAPLYFEAQQYLTDHFSLLAGAQLVYASREFVDRFDDPVVGNQSHQQKFFGANPKLGAIYEINPATQIFANVSRSWQPPTLDNLASFSEGSQSALVYHSLAAQHAWTAEIGARGKHGCAEWELAVYDSHLRDELLELNDANGNNIGTTNVARSFHRGVEAGFEIDLLEAIRGQEADDHPRDRLSLDQTYTWNDFHFANDAVYRDNRIAGIPEHVYEMQLLYEMPSGFYFGPNLRCDATRYPVDQANTLFAAPYALLGFKAGYRAKRGWSVFVEAKNLTNARYPAAVDPIADARTQDDVRVFHPGDGRSIYTGVSVTW